jgi:hypothetical protein
MNNDEWYIRPSLEVTRHEYKPALDAELILLDASLGIIEGIAAACRIRNAVASHDDKKIV